MSDFSILLISIAAAIIPTLVYLLLIYLVDRYEKEPLWLLSGAFLWGAVPSIVVAFIVNTTLSTPFYLLVGGPSADALTASFIAPPAEETVKGLAVLGIFFLWRNEFDSVLDGIIYGAIVGMGFAMVENVYYFVDQLQTGGLQAWGTNVFFRGVVFGLNHALFTSMTGLGVAIARMSTQRRVKIVAPLVGWMAAIFLHFVHNFSVSMGDWLCFVALIFDWGGVLLTLAIIIWAAIQERQWLRDYLADEVEAGTLTADQYAIACSGRKRLRANLNRLFSQGIGAFRASVSFFHRCSELAYKKHHHSLFADDESAELADELRQKISTLSRQVGQ